MAAPFAAALARLNTSVFARLANAEAVVAGQVVFGLFSTPDENLNMGGINIISTMYELLLPTSIVQSGALATGSSITVNGLAYEVRDVMLADDGFYSRISLSK